MDKHGSFVARLLDAGLRGLASEIAVRQRRILQDSGVELPSEAVPSLIGDTEARILVLGEALATGKPALFVEQLEWNRSAYAARGVSEEGLALNLLCLREVLTRELPPVAHEVVLAVLDRADRSFERPPRVVESVLDADAAYARRIRTALVAILEGRRDDALRLLLAPLDEGLSVSEIETRIVAPLQAEVGLMWQRGEIHVHEEHLGSQIIEEALVLLRSKLARSAPNGKSVLVCSVAGNLHDMGSRIVADHFEIDGWNTVRLGANVPGEDLGRAVIDFRADLVALSVTLTSQVRNTAAIIEAMRAYCGAQEPPILVGGPPFSLVPDLWQAVGADGCADSAQSAVREGRRLLGIA
ncbi:MAG: cobalamin-dependent protein [Planctomycetes bacterium]|nr:cobalamin-dependent protein [Planctomycetota bacterium]